MARGLEYPEESAGRLMQTDFIAVPPFWDVGQAIDYMREEEELPDEFYMLFVVDPGLPPGRHGGARPVAPEQAADADLRHHGDRRRRR